MSRIKLTSVFYARATDASASPRGDIFYLGRSTKLLKIETIKVGIGMDQSLSVELSN